LFAKLFEPSVENASIIQYPTWQCGQRSTETLIL